MAADQIDCPNRKGDRCIGTAQPDEVIGSRDDDTIGEVGGDTIVAARCGLPRGADVFGGRGDDDITITSDCGDLAVVPPPDRVDCGPGYDVVRGPRRQDRRVLRAGGAAADVLKVVRTAGQRRDRRPRRGTRSAVGGCLE